VKIKFFYPGCVRILQCRLQCIHKPFETQSEDTLFNDDIVLETKRTKYVIGNLEMKVEVQTGILKIKILIYIFLLKMNLYDTGTSKYVFCSKQV